MKKEILSEIIGTILIGIVCVIVGIMIGITIVSIKRVTVSDATRTYLISCEKTVG